MHADDPSDPSGLKSKNAIKLFAVLGSVVPLGIGLTVLGFVWSGPLNGFGSLPLFFRIFMSFIALGFVIPAIASIFVTLTGIDVVHHHLKNRGRPFVGNSSSERNDASINSCSQCGAPLDGSSEISPSGDVKCTHCGKWFNVRGNW